MPISKDGDYRRKIKTREELAKAIGPRPRAKSVIMCHGTFDIVHPGHIRHLMYAREKADILIASLTCDAHISKGNFRPFVPEQLRAMNLAALEVVDYVIIDQNPTPLENIQFLQPDLFAKGYEYTKGGLHPKTREELDVLESYGGEIIFTPGDVVYSSSVFIELAPPNIATEKLSILMESEGITFNDLRIALNLFEGVRVHVVGDTIVDSYTYGTMIGGMTKTPTISIKHEHRLISVAALRSSLSICVRPALR
jgi:rfaE bifunctional protein nucleotidyltransferase chain/domain